MKICIINFADGVFEKGQDRLAESLRSVGFTGDLHFYNDLPKSWPTHEEVPWGFKTFAFEEARKNGYDMALWIDASGIAFRKIDKIINMMKKQGVFLFSRYNAPVGEWSSDYALKQLDITREESFHIPEISGFIIGINFKHEIGKKFLSEWKKCAEDTISFIGVPKPYSLEDSMTNDSGLLSADPRVRGHRHDQTVASIIAYRLNIPLTNRYVFDLIGEGGKGKSYADYIPLDAIVIQNRDIKTDHYLKNLSRYRFSLHAFYKTLLRYSKDFIKWMFVYRKRYKRYTKA